MPGGKKKTSIFVEPEMLEHLRAKAADDSRSISDIIDEAVSLLASEDAEDIADFDARIGEPNIGYDEFAHRLKADGII
jgi:predicted DNA-binding protein